MKDQLKTLALMFGAGVIVWALFTALTFSYNLNKLLSGQCTVVEQSVIDKAVEEALTEYKASVDNP